MGCSPLATDVMAYLATLGLRPTPWRFAVARYLAEHDTLDLGAVAPELAAMMPGSHRATLRRVVITFERAGLVERQSERSRDCYRLRPRERWGVLAPAANTA
jgi:Fe2+ or Zn2+ uptake regulation protein